MESYKAQLCHKTNHVAKVRLNFSPQVTRMGKYVVLGWAILHLSDHTTISVIASRQIMAYGRFLFSTTKRSPQRSVGAILSHSIMIMPKPRTSCWSLTNFTNVTLCLGTTIKFDYVANKPTAWTVLLFVASQNSAAHGFVSCTTSAIEGKIGLNWSWCSYNATLRGNLSWWAHKWVGGS